MKCPIAPTARRAASKSTHHSSNTVSTYVLVLALAFAAMLAGNVSVNAKRFAVRVSPTTPPPQIWTGPRVTFTRGSNGGTQNQDRLTANVWLTRADTQGIFNIAMEPSYQSSSPIDTEWAFGTTASLPANFLPWVDWANHFPPGTVGQDAVLHLISDNIYIDIKFTSWQAQNGGGFSYERSTPVPTAANGTISGEIVDTREAPVSGVTINLSGRESREIITDSNGHYSFDNVETNGFYTVTPSRANYTFFPAARSFSLLGANTEASFTASANDDQTAVFNGRIAAASTRNSQAFNIYSINPDGSSPIRLTDDQGHANNPNGPTYDFDQAWSPDGSKLAFASNRDGDSFEIFTMNAYGSNVQRLTNNQIDEGQPAWSPHGSKIAFTRGGGCLILTKPQLAPADDDPCVAYIYVMNSDGSNPMKLSAAGGDAGPVWSPDGSKIAFTNYIPNRADTNEIYVMNADGSGRVRLTNNTSIDYVTSWSPDGRKLAFASNRDTPPDGAWRFQLYTMNVDGSSQSRLTNNLFDDNYPVFSPDGTRIAFQRGQSSPVNPSDNTEIFVMNTDGGNQRNITNNRADDFGPPAWQPLSSPPQIPPPAVLQFDSSSYSVNENAGSLSVNVTRSGNTTEATSAQYESSDGSALDRSDYTPAFGTFSFAPGETSKSFSILLTDDAFVENPETIVLSLHDLTGNAILGTSGQATISIADNDSAPASNPVDDSQFFVRQHYHDFFNREPDAPGFAFWVNNIESCGIDAHCREVKRIDTSAAFFLSIEFQQTGYYVYRLYTGSVVPPGYSEFMRDTQEIGRDLIVGAPGWEAQLDANVQKFTEAFVSRPLFTGAYPEGLSAQTYVDRLCAHQFLTPPPAERADAIAAYGSGDTAGRARALRIIANNATFRQQLFNQSFVLMQYFGYLRRDADYQGYDFWKRKLNEFNGDFRKAEMVKAFIVSGEYRQRFGPQ